MIALVDTKGHRLYNSPSYEKTLGYSPDELARTQALVETLMGRRPELRFEYIQKNARFARDLDV